MCYAARTLLRRRVVGLALCGVGLTACEKPIELSGVVVSQLDGSPVRGVSVVHLADPPAQLGTTSDDGCFAYKRVHDRSNRRRRIEFSARGYATTTISLPGQGASRVRVVLTPEAVGAPSQASIDSSGSPLPCASAR